MAEARHLEEADAFFEKLTKRDGHLFHIMNARRENSSTEFDGEAFSAAARSKLEESLDTYDKVLNLFKDHSVDRA